VAKSPKRPRTKWVVAAAVTAAALSVGVFALKPWGARTALEQFWRPVLDSSNTVLLCIGQRRFLGTSPESASETGADIERFRNRLADPISLFRLYYMGSQNIAFPDVVTFGQIAGLLRSKGKAYHLRGESSTTFADLRDGPVILIGAFNNDWTLRLMGPLRFNYERDDATFWIQDRQNPTRRNRAVDYGMPYLKLTEDYALISRTLEPTTQRMVIVVGGLTGYGTLAAGEFLSDPAYMEEAVKQAPRDWQHRNIQFVIATKVINGNSGPPRVVDRYFW
jgi:hypothetical protein